LNKMGMGGMMGGMGGGGGNSKVNIGAMQSHLQKNMKLSKMKERMQQKLQQQRAAAQAAAAQAQAAAAPPPPPKKTSQVFSTGEVVDKTDRNAGPVPGSGCTVDSSFAPAASISSKKNKKK